MFFSELTHHDGFKQVAVFTREELIEVFNNSLEKDQSKLCIPKCELFQSGRGAIYLVRAVKQISGKYKSCIRCGLTGHMIYGKRPNFYTEYSHAIFEGINYLETLITESLNSFKIKESK